MLLNDKYNNSLPSNNYIVSVKTMTCGKWKQVNDLWRNTDFAVVTGIFSYICSTSENAEVNDAGFY